MIRGALKAITVLLLSSSLAACSEEPPDRPDRGQTSTEPRVSPTAITTPEGKATQASESAGRTVIESTVGGAILRRDEGVLRIERAELLRAKEGDEIFVRATVKGPAEARDCYLIKGSTWFALRNAIEEDVSYAPQVLEATWADPAATTRFSGGGTLALSFQEDVNRIDEDPDPRDTPFFAVCYKFASTGEGTGATWYDVAHVEGSPKAP